MADIKKYEVSFEAESADTANILSFLIVRALSGLAIDGKANIKNIVIKETDTSNS